MRLNPLAALKRSLARKARLPEIHTRLDNQHDRLLGLRHKIEDVSKNIEHVVTSSESNLRTQLAAVSHSLVRLQESVVPLQESVVPLQESVVRLQESVYEMQRNLDSGLTNAENRLLSLNDALVVHVEKFRGIDRNWASTELAQLRRALDNIRRSMENLVSSAIRQPADSSSLHVSGRRISDLDYIDLEDAFRGSQETISQRQSTYLPLIEAITMEGVVLDLGCGRGEWLSLLTAKGVRSVGIDTNSSCIAECRDRGLNVENAELIDYLSKVPEQTVRAITAFQVFEHLSFRDLREVVRLAQRALVPGGLLLAEVPNAKNARVASGTFWIDPTHVRPWYPDLLEHLARDAGFARVEGRYVNPLVEKPRLEALDEESQKALHAVFEALFGPADFALIAYT